MQPISHMATALFDTVSERRFRYHADPRLTSRHHRCSALCGSAPARPPRTRTWKGGGGGNTWLNPHNWVGNDQPAPGDTLIFPEGAAGQHRQRLPRGHEFAAITVAEGYTISGNRILLANSLTVTDDGQRASLDLRQHPAEGAGHGHHARSRHPAAADTRALDDWRDQRQRHRAAAQGRSWTGDDERGPWVHRSDDGGGRRASRSSRSGRSASPAKARRC